MARAEPTGDVDRAMGLDWGTWRPHYERIVDELGLDAEADAAAARTLVAVLPPSAIASLDELGALVAGQDVIVLGNGAGLARLLPRIGTDDVGTPVVACGSATARAVHADVWPDVVVTDLDGDAELQRQAADHGALTCIAAHGDNVELVERWVPAWPGPVVPTCQTEPFGPLVNVGGFTDGDRALFLLEAAGAASARLVGFDLRHPRPDTPAKAAKLAIARRLIDELHLPVDPYKPGR